MEELVRISVMSDHGSFPGEIKAMMEILEASTGKKPLSDLEKSIYEIYHKRLQEIRVSVKQARKKKKNNKT